MGAMKWLIILTLGLLGAIMCDYNNMSFIQIIFTGTVFSMMGMGINNLEE